MEDRVTGAAAVSNVPAMVAAMIAAPDLSIDVRQHDLRPGSACGALQPPFPFRIVLGDGPEDRAGASVPMTVPPKIVGDAK